MNFGRNRTRAELLALVNESKELGMTRAAWVWERALEDRDAGITQEPRQDTGLTPEVDTDDDPPAMPSLDLALARIEAESPAAATAARAYLDGSEGKSTAIRVRVTVAEHAQIQQTAKALGYGSMSEYMRARALA